MTCNIKVISFCQPDYNKLLIDCRECKQGIVDSVHGLFYLELDDPDVTLSDAVRQA